MTKLIVEVVALGSIFWLEELFPFFEGRTQRLRHTSYNIALGILNVLCVSLFFSSMTVWISSWTNLKVVGVLNLTAITPSMKWILAFILFDLWMYLWHVVNHQLHFLWRFHRMHHADLELDSTTALRFHTGEIIFSSLLRLLVIPILGIEFSQLFIYELCLQPVIIFHHSNVALSEKWDRLLRILIVTPNMHRIHHSQERFETNSNYSSIFSVWDRIGKTFQKREDLKTICYGLPEIHGNQWQNIFGMLKIPFVNFSRPPS